MTETISFDNKINITLNCLRNVICNGNEKRFQWLLKWMNIVTKHADDPLFCMPIFPGTPSHPSRSPMQEMLSVDKNDVVMKEIIYENQKYYAICPCYSSKKTNNEMFFYVKPTSDKQTNDNYFEELILVLHVIAKLRGHSFYVLAFSNYIKTK